MKALDKAIAFIDEAGFGYIKLELEATLNRRNGTRCRSCTSGRVECDTCTGEGYIDNGDMLDADDCDECDGTGRITCGNCGGRGQLDAIYSSESTCHRFILNEVSKELFDETLDERRARLGTPSARSAAHGSYNIADYKLIDGLKYAEFYNDGSVDSEITFTVPLSEHRLLPAFIRAFKKLAEAVGNGMDVQGAGMHTAVLLKTSRGSYPTSGQLNGTKFANFQEQVNKLLPALYVCASSGHQSRSLNFRSPKVSHSSKYSAIYSRSNTVLEYRVFETCYDRPEAVYDYLKVIANTLRFYHDPSLKVSTQGKQFIFPSGNQVARFFSTIENLRIINSQMKYLKPEDKTYKEIKAERGIIGGTVRDLLTKRKIDEQKLKADYSQHKKVYDDLVKRPLTANERITVDRYVIEGYRYDAAVARARGQRPLEPVRQFIEKNINRVTVETSITV